VAQAQLIYTIHWTQSYDVDIGESKVVSAEKSMIHASPMGIVIIPAYDRETRKMPH
jgi:hypothetical protein